MGLSPPLGPWWGVHTSNPPDKVRTRSGVIPTARAGAAQIEAVGNVGRPQELAYCNK